MKRPRFKILSGDGELVEEQINELIESLSDHEGYDIVDTSTVMMVRYSPAGFHVDSYMCMTVIIAIIDNS